MFCSDSPDILLSKTEKYRNTVVVGCRGWQKPDPQLVFPGIHIADSSTHQLKNPTSKIQQNQAKSKIPPIKTLYRTQYRQNPLKSSISVTSQPKIKLPFH